jgi:hypothetical protein
MLDTLEKIWNLTARVRAAWRERQAEAPKNALRERFMRCFKAQGIEPLQVARLMPAGVPLSDAQLLDADELLRALNPVRRDHVADLLGIEHSWLDGAEDRIYPHLFVYKNPGAFLDLLVKATTKHERVEFWVAKGADNDLDGFPSMSALACGLRVTVGTVGETTVWRDLPLSDVWNWQHPDGRIGIKAMCLMAWQFGVHLKGFNNRQKDIQEFFDGKLFVSELIGRAVGSFWHPDDYIFTEAESCRAIDPKDALCVRAWLKEQKVMDRPSCTRH